MISAEHAAADGTTHPLRSPALAYCALAFAISWACMLGVLGGPAGIPRRPDEVARLMPAVVLAMFAGPSVAGIGMVLAVSGRVGLRDLGARLFRWRVGVRWYAVALLTAPVSMTAILLALSRRSPDFLPPIVTSPHRAPLALLALGAVAVGGLLEEIGWTGFLIPTLRRRHGVLATGVVVGAVWGAWHLLANVWYAGAAAGGLSRASFVTLYFLAGVAQLVAYRILMVWVYERTESLLVATLMHGSLIASTALPVLAPPTTGVAFLTWLSASAGVLWAIVAVVALVTRRAASAT